MEVTPDQITDYEACPRFYDFKYNDESTQGKSNKRKEESDKFLQTLSKVSNYYLYKKQSFSDPTLKSLYNRWQKDWYGDMSAKDIVTMQNSVQQRSKTSYSTRAMEVIRNIYSDFESVSGDQVFWLNEDYVVPILNQEGVLTGTVDLVLRQKEQNRFHIFRWADSTQPIHVHKYHMAAAEYALRYRYDFKEMNTRHYLWYLYGPKIGRKEVTTETKDFDLMGYFADQIRKDEFFVPRFGFSTYCKSCPYSTKCVRWEFPKGEDND